MHFYIRPAAGSPVGPGASNIGFSSGAPECWKAQTTKKWHPIESNAINVKTMGELPARSQQLQGDQ